jgi:hypothetical protein
LLANTDYKVQPRPEDKMRRLKTAFALTHSNEMGTAPDMLVTFTSQTTQGKFESDPAAAAILTGSVGSFKVSGPPK